MSTAVPPSVPPVDALVPASEVASRVLPLRPPPRKLSLRVSGAKIGSTARPAIDGRLAAGPAPTHQLGLRVHSSIASPSLARPAPSAPSASFGREDYASAEDYE